jgi:hypothetical protein
MSMPRYTSIHESYRQCEGECLTAWGKLEYTPPMPAIEQAIVIAIAARLLYNYRQINLRPDRMGLGGAGAVEAVLKTLKFTKETPAEFAERQGEDD